MNRLTGYDANGALVVNEEQVIIASRNISKDEIYKIMTHLAEKLSMYEDLEEQGKLLKLPCKIRDTVYLTKKYNRDNSVETGVFPKKVTEIKMSFEEGIVKCFLSLEGQYFNFDKIGKEVFLSKEEATLHIKTQEEKYMSTESLIGKRYLDKQRLPGALKEVLSGPDEWGSYVVKDLKTGKEHLCSERYIMQNEVDEKSFEEWWDELDDIEKEEYNAIMSEGSGEITDNEIEK